ncbi:EF-hand domain-containing protein [Paucibacter sp. KBW04]|uniref:EF-hand domain-containing protein n=1 Tax=Paucibacter sp. KBW04 TaxID=2153361 RepID=UPI0018CBFA15|nr:EF-hand domain-containing protein [Paucibacter sp. KBW04]
MKTQTFPVVRPLLLTMASALALVVWVPVATAAPAGQPAAPVLLQAKSTDLPARPPSPSAIRRAFERSDLNHDGFISLEEFHKDMVQSWHALDLDQDGFISREELQAAAGAKHAERVLRALHHFDKNADLRLSFKEVIGARMAGFDAADLNHDDKLSLQEVLDYELKAGQRLLTQGLPKAKRGR